MRWPTPRAALVACLAATLLLAACNEVPPPPRGPTPLPLRTPAASATTAAANHGVLSCHPAQPLTSLALVARTDIGPDDLLALPDGTLWVSDPDSGHLEHLDAAGHLLQRITDDRSPEGMVATAAGIVLAEQTTNQLVRFMPPGTARTTLLPLPARQGAEGIDGIGIDPARGRLLIPDSPQGALFSSATDGSDARLLAVGLGRDVAAAVGPDGAIWVAVEGSRGLLRVPAAGGSAAAVGGSDLTQLDDVVAVGSLLYATSLTTNEVVAIDPATGADRVLVTGGHSLQGLALLADGRLAIADSTSHVVAAVRPCS